MQTLLRVCRNVLTARAPAVWTEPQNRDLMVDARMYRDYKRRKMVKEYAFERLQYTAMKRNDILPKALQEVVSQELHAFPLNSCFTRMHNRCVLTSRARSVDVRYRMARMAWRHLADYNKLSGVQRAMWPL
ncbi:28S ribosomal protein S14, mitochondrial-like isoform X2 [Varroa jacobsoni]|uniref:28S ribosomal protein S14, mitochondrial-like isoform X2 n=1 Tax=Varroa jacobsoni TaxID=62625 RepID=UPI000BF611B5|nr:28S ribosomal protein S14, mitochondrial-like isoform X2 [Varroa jacobsoni]